MSLFSRARDILSGGRRTLLRAARRAEALGQLAEATALFLEAEAPDQAARLFCLRADAALDSSERYLLLGQALTHAQGEQADDIERRRRRLALDLVRSGAMEMTGADLRELAAALERLGDPTLAAEVYERLGDRESEARVLVDAGAIERLESVLSEDQERTRTERARVELGARLRDWVASGQRRQALTEGRAASGEDPTIADLLRRVADTKASAPRATLELDGAPSVVVFGSEVTVGRAGATICLAAPGISREHLALRGSPEGPRAVDLGSRNGTLLRGVRLDAPLLVSDRVELALGGDVPIVLEPWQHGGVRVECGGEVMLAPLGPLRFGSWSIEPAADGWLELDAPDGACLGALQVQGRIQLCVGDELSETRHGGVKLRVVA